MKLFTRWFFGFFGCCALLVHAQIVLPPVPPVRLGQAELSSDEIVARKQAARTLLEAGQIKLESVRTPDVKRSVFPKKGTYELHRTVRPCFNGELKTSVETDERGNFVSYTPGRLHDCPGVMLIIDPVTRHADLFEWNAAAQSWGPRVPHKVILVD